MNASRQGGVRKGLSPFALVTALAVCGLGLAGCHVTVVDDAGAAGSSGSSASETPAPFACPSWDDASGTDVQGLVDAVFADLEAAGTPADPSIWDDEARFGDFIQRVYDKAGCELVTAEPGALARPGVNYCGPGFGAPAVLRPTVSTCMNNACQRHDACYATCKPRLQKSCYWSPEASPCDDELKSAFVGCGTSGLIEWIVRLVAEHEWPSVNTCPDTQCPSPGSFGDGVCATDAASADCTACLDKTDASCPNTQCDGGMTDLQCVAASCSSVVQCISGTGYGAPTTAGATQPDPTSTWTILLLSGTMPSSKTTGESWDADASPPDPIVRTEMPSSVSTSSKVQDSYNPSWSESVAWGVPVSTLFGGEVQFYVRDSDLIFDDEVGACWFGDVATAFGGAPVTLQCSPADLSLQVQLVQE